MKKKFCKVLFLFLFLGLGLWGCRNNQPATLKVGTISGPETELMETAQAVAKKQYDLNFKIVAFNDYNLPNAALNDGSIDANVFQHSLFLQQQLNDHHYNLVTIGKTFVYPMGIYSKKIKRLADLDDGSHVAIPNDPSNESRALLLLEKAKLIELDHNAGVDITPVDIKSNPFNLVITALDAANLPRALDDVDLAVINTNYAIPSGLSPNKALFLEDKDSPYANLVVVRVNDKNDPRLQQLVASLHSPQVIAKAKELFGDGAVPAF